MNQYQDTTLSLENLEQLLQAPLDVKLLAMRHYQEIARLLAAQLMEEEVEELAGSRYSHDKPHDGRYVRWGSNPGSVKVGSEKLPIKVPRVRDTHESEEAPLSTYQALHQGLDTEAEERLSEAILLGLSQRDYQRVASDYADGFSLSQSSVSRKFIQASRKALERFERRSLAEEDLVALWLDGKHLGGERIVICMGLRLDGSRFVLGFIESSSENAQAVKGLFTDLIERGLRFDQGLLIVIDGSKGLAKAARETFGQYAIIQRCQWHKRTNVIGYLNQSDEQAYKAKIQSAYQRSNYREAKEALMAIHAELQQLNRSAARSLMEGFEETLTLHRLGVFPDLGHHLKTTNCIESLNSQMAKYLDHKIKNWKHSDMRHRWVAMALLEIEPKLQRAQHARRLPLLRQALRRELGLEEPTDS